jgi:hypothetical protein
MITRRVQLTIVCASGAALTSLEKRKNIQLYIRDGSSFISADIESVTGVQSLGDDDARAVKRAAKAKPRKKAWRRKPLRRKG